MSQRFSNIAFLVLILSGCHKTNNSQHSGQGTPPDNIFLAGQLDSGGLRYLRYWQKGKSVQLAQGVVGQGSGAVTGIAVNGSDVYVCGYLHDVRYTAASFFEAAYWKNGALVYLGDSSRNSFATGISISGTDVFISGYYTAGNGYATAVYWKNGIEVVLSDSTQYAVTANAIAVSGSDIYVAGGLGLDPNDEKPAAVVWKNGVMFYVGDSSQGGFADCIAINNGNVYTGGWKGYYNNVALSNTINYATYWTNGIASNIGDSGLDSRISGIAVLGSDLYAVGNSGLTPFRSVYWKNGTQFILENSSYSSATSIAVSGSDIYIGGSSQAQGSGAGATYWKNGNPVYLNNGSLITALCLPSP